MENFISVRAESYKSAIKCCGGEETSSVDSKDSMLEAGGYVERLSFWQRPKQKVDLEFIDVSYSVKHGRKGEPSYFPAFYNKTPYGFAVSKYEQVAGLRQIIERDNVSKLAITKLEKVNLVSVLFETD